MDKKLNELGRLYEQMEVPDQLDEVLRQAMQHEANRKVIDMKRVSKVMRGAVALAASFILVISAGVNVSPSFAQTLYEIPGVETFARLVTIRTYEFENDTSLGQIEVPEVEYEANKAVEEKINGIIRNTVDLLVEEQAMLDAEYKQAYLETGGTEEGYAKIETTIDYELKYRDEHIISFEVFKYQTLAPAYNENFYYTFDLSSGEQLKIMDVLGENYTSLVAGSVWDQMQERMQADEKLTYFVSAEDEIQIDEDHSFYVNNEGQVVAVFAKYEVAAGYMGVQEFIITDL